MPAQKEDFKALVSRLRRERDMSLEDLAFEARAHAPQGSVSLSLIQKRLAPGSDVTPSPEMLAGLAFALGVQPEAFGEYRLAMARRLLDEKAMGSLDAALENLSYFEEGLRLHEKRFLEANGIAPIDVEVNADQGADIVVKDDSGTMLMTIELKAPRNAEEPSRKAKLYLDANVIFAFLKGSVTRIPADAEADLELALREEAQRTLEHPDTPAGAPADEDSRETRG